MARVITTPLDGRSRRTQLRRWREQVNAQVARDAGFAYEAYVRLKLASVRAFITGADRQAARRAAHSPLSRVVAEIIDAWAARTGLIIDQSTSDALQARRRPRTVPALGQVSARLRRRLSRAPPAFPDRRAEPAL